MEVTIFSQISIDGKLTFGEGQSSKEMFELLGPEDIAYIHQFRGQVDGIMVGKNTICTDNPFLTNRYEPGRNPVRIVPSRTLDIPLNSNIFLDEERTIIVTTERGLDEDKKRRITSLGKEVMVCGEDLVDFDQLFRRLESDYGIHRLMVEGGGLLNWYVFDRNLVDQIILMQLPIIIGGGSNITLVDGEGYNALTFSKRFRVVDVQPSPNYTLMRYARADAAGEDRLLHG